MNKEAQAVFLEYFCKGLQKEANLSVSESIGVAIWFADQKYLLTKKAADPVTPPPATTTPLPTIAVRTEAKAIHGMIKVMAAISFKLGNIVILSLVSSSSSLFLCLKNIMRPRVRWTKPRWVRLR